MFESMHITVLIPAWNEEDVIEASINSLYAQTRKPDRIVVVPNNTTDQTNIKAFSAGAEVIPMPGVNHEKKAGALNFILDKLSAELDFFPNSAVLVMDADTILATEFIEKAELEMARDNYVGGVSSIFTGRSTNNILGILQRLEFARYGAIAKKRAEVFVLSGTASLIRWQSLKEIKAARLEGKRLPKGKSYYDVDSMTEDNEMTFAILTIGYSTPHCGVESVTDVMEDLSGLYHQRKRWYLGALQNIRAYSTKMPIWMRFVYWGQQVGLYLSMIVTPVVLSAFLTYLFVGFRDVSQISPFHYLFFIAYVLTQVVTVWKLGWSARIIALLYIPEIVYSLFLIFFYSTALWSFVRRREMRWKHT